MILALLLVQAVLTTAPHVVMPSHVRPVPLLVCSPTA